MALSEWSLDEFLGELRSYLSSPIQVEFHATLPADALREAEAGRHKDENPAGLLDSYGDWLCTKALVAIAERGPDGWLTLRRGLHWRYWGFWISVEDRCHYRPTRRGRSSALNGMTVEEVGWMFVHALATRDDELAKTCGEWLQWMLDDCGRWALGLESFFLELCWRWTGQPRPEKRPDLPPLGPYEGIFESLDQPRQFASAIAAISDYHCERAMAELRDDDVEPTGFYDYPFKMFPAEVLALKRICEDEGHPYPDVRHPLLDTPWYRDVPRHPPDFRDPTLDTLRSYFPRILDNVDASSPWR